MEVDAKTLKDWLDSGEAALVDVREKDEYSAEHIPGSVLHPIGQLDSFDLEKYETKKIVFHCGGGGRGGRATSKITSEHPEVFAYNLRGGMRSWKAAGFETKKA